MSKAGFGVVFLLAASIAAAQHDQALPLAEPADRLPMSQSDLDYLRSLAKDTWHCIAGMEEPKTGLPFDNSDHGENTSVSNIGMYLTCVAAAGHMKLITPAEEELRLDRCLSSVEKLQTWFGFRQCWNSVRTLQPGTNDRWISLIDSGNLAAALTAVSEGAPKFHLRCQKILNAMQWGRFYDSGQAALIGGYSTEKKAFNPQWHLNLLASDAHLAQFFAVASGGAPFPIWTTFDRSTETQDGATFFKPGWQGGGLFMQFISGLWLDQRQTVLGRSAQNFAWAQIRHGRALKTPWGWSASDNPAGGYLGWGALKDEVVTPHACALAIEYYPHEVVANLRALESLGVRSKEDGFFDAVDVKTGKRSKLFLMLDQGMLFLSLANYLDGNVIRGWFQLDPTVRMGRSLIADYRDRSYKDH